MSALVDLWTRESARLREKNNTSAAREGPEAHGVVAPKPSLRDALKIKVKLPRSVFSEEGLAVMVHCFSA